MKRPKVISVKQLPMRLPITPTITLWLLLDRMHVPSWAWGVFYTIFSLFWIVAIIAFFTQENVELKELQ